MIGRSIAHYTITDKLGEGAMGEVYRATDARLNRTVAIKMLSGRFAGDPALLERLRQEAEVLASLSHAHIGQIYGIEEAGGSSLALVLEYVDGPTLEDRLKEGPLPRGQALRIAHQIAAALESAHERGIIHRDLKPGNVKLTGDGDAKVLDFGLAKGIDAGAAKAGMTADGVVLGTPRYMSPEQVEGRKLDRRTDIWSFGCVLYEMLAGEQAFRADSVGSLFVAITGKDIDLEQLGNVPSALRRLVERCLRKDPRTRLRDMGDVRVELEDLIAGRADAVAAAPTHPRRTRSLAVALAALAAGAIIGGLAAWSRSTNGRNADRPVGRFSILLPAPMDLRPDTSTGMASPLAISPDGQTVVFSAVDNAGERWLWLRSAADGVVRKLEHTKDAQVPFFSPDGKQVGFAGEGGDNLHRISLADGTVHHIRDVYGVRGATWGVDDTIVYGDFDKGLMRVSASGGEATRVTTPREGELDHRSPQFLPGGRSVLFIASMRDHLEPRIVSLETGKITAVPVQGAVARYVEGGFLVFMRSADLWCQRFDLATGRVAGEAKRVVSGIHESDLGAHHLAVSEKGVLVYEPERPPSPGRRLVWVDRAGNSKELAKDKNFEFPRLSPNGHSVVFAVHTSSTNHDIWTIDIERGTDVKITTGGNNLEPIWLDDAEVAFCGADVGGIFRQRPGDSERTLVRDLEGTQTPLCLGKDGWLVYLDSSGQNSGYDIKELNLKDKTIPPRKLVCTPFSESGAAVSPDGRWLAYVSDETGRKDVYLRSYPDTGTKTRVSVNGGDEPVWSRDGRELFFRNGRAVFVWKMEADGKSAPTRLFDGDFVAGFAGRADYDVSADGEHLIMVEGGLGLTAGRLEIHLNLPGELDLALPLRE